MMKTINKECLRRLASAVYYLFKAKDNPEAYIMTILSFSQDVDKCLKNISQSEIDQKDILYIVERYVRSVMNGEDLENRMRAEGYNIEETE